MLLTLEGLPQDDEIVLCTVTSVQHHSVFVTLDEYNNKTAMIHISEVAPGRIRNIRDFVEEGKKAICKVLKVNAEKGYVDLSLRRVNESQKRQKNNEIKKEQLAEKIIEKLARDTKKDGKKLYHQIYDSIKESHQRLYPAFEDIIHDEIKLEKIGLDKKTAEQLLQIIQQTIKPEEISIEGELTLKTYDSTGVELIKEALKKIQQNQIEVNYKGGGVYRVILKGNDYKTVERKIAPTLEKLEKFAKQNKITISFKRIETE